jgi:hypothetical protein
MYAFKFGDSGGSRITSVPASRTSPIRPFAETTVTAARQPCQKSTADFVTSFDFLDITRSSILAIDSAVDPMSYFCQERTFTALAAWKQRAMNGTK